MTGLTSNDPDLEFSTDPKDGSDRATVAAWTRGVTSWDGLRTAAIDTPQAPVASRGAAAIERALDALRRDGFEAVIGPMRGNTWRRYRLVVERGEREAFFMEPWTSDEDLAAFERAGFQPIAHYVSAEVTDLSITDPRLERAEQRLTAAGISIRPIDLDRFDDELDAVYELSLTAFDQNPFYTPIDRGAFIAMYRPIQEHIAPELVTIAEKDGDVVGFLFGIPDLDQARRGSITDTVIIKSLARAKSRTYSGLGALLMQQCHHTAMRLGMRRAIHALMHEANTSLRVSSRYARIFRRYALYGRRLQP